MPTLWRALLLGAGFGLAAAVVETALGGIGILERRMGPGPAYLLQLALPLVALGALLGAVGAPLRRLPAGALLHLAWLALAWLGLARWVEFEAPMGRMFVLAPPIGAALLTAAGMGLARWRAWLPPAVGIALLGAAAVGPQLAVDLTSPPPAVPARLPPAPAGAPDVVVVVLDTVRAESVSGYGYERETAPFFDALAREGALFTDATAPSTWSLPSHASLFTGRYPTAHGAHAEHQFLDDRFPTLAQALSANGYETFCFTANAWISDGLGLTRGFGWQDGSWRRFGGAGRNFSFVNRLLDRLGWIEGDKGGGVVASRFADWARARPADARPAFAFLNFIEAHWPYHQLPAEYRTRWTDRPRSELEELSMALMAQQFGGPGRDVAEVGEPARAMYDGGILYTDRLLERVVEALRARGTLDRTVLVVLADHGELLGERDGYFGHGPSMYQPMISVPLLVRYPPQIPAGAVVDAPVSTLGVFATVLDLAGLEPPPTLQVGSLAPVARGEADAHAGPVIAEKLSRPEPSDADPHTDPQLRTGVRLRAFRDGRWKLVETSLGDTYLYDLAADPRETRDVAGAHPAELARLRAALADARARIGLPAIDAELATGEDAPALDDATRERLRALGYAE